MAPTLPWPAEDAIRCGSAACGRAAAEGGEGGREDERYGSVTPEDPALMDDDGRRGQLVVTW